MDVNKKEDFEALEKEAYSIVKKWLIPYLKNLGKNPLRKIEVYNLFSELKLSEDLKNIVFIQLGRYFRYRDEHFEKKKETPTEKPLS